MSPEQKRARATELRLRSLENLREAAGLEREAALEDAIIRNGENEDVARKQVSTLPGYPGLLMRQRSL